MPQIAIDDSTVQARLHRGRGRDAPLGDKSDSRAEKGDGDAGTGEFIPRRMCGEAWRLRRVRADNSR